MGYIASSGRAFRLGLLVLQMVTQLGRQHALGQLFLEPPDQAGFAQQALGIPAAQLRLLARSCLVCAGHRQKAVRLKFYALGNGSQQAGSMTGDGLAG
ncbi:MAG TPA: hypothetical protein VNJ47_05790 [Nevskiales bacterium]|nr:hypothetical protein [Nevskiales bacterium]